MKQEPNQPLRRLTVDDVRKLVKVEADILQILRTAHQTGGGGSRGAVTGELPFGLHPGSAWSANQKLIQDLPSDLSVPFAEWKRLRFELE